MQKNIRVPDDVDWQRLIDEAAVELWRQGYTVAQYPNRENYSASAVIVAALMYAAGRKPDESPTPSDEPVGSAANNTLE